MKRPRPAFGFLLDAHGFTGAERALLIAFALAIVTLIGALISHGTGQAGSDAAQVLREHGVRATGRLQAVGQVLHAGDIRLPRPEPELAKPVKEVYDAQVGKQGADGKTTLRDTVATEGFGKLNQEEQLRLLTYAGGTNKAISEPVRKALDAEIRTPRFERADAAGQAAILRDFLKNQPGLPGLVTAEDGAYDKGRSAFTVSEATEVKDYEFRSGKADALKYTVEINGAKIPVYLPRTPDKDAGHIHSIQEIGRGLAALPPETRRLIRGVSQNPGQNPEDKQWIKELKDPNFRSYQTADASGNVSIYPTLDPVSQTNFDTTIIHETGHTLSLTQWGNPFDSWNPRWNGWKSAIAKDQLQVSKYGSANPVEDFSESLALYITYRGKPEFDELRKIYPNRFKVLDGLVGK